MRVGGQGGLDPPQNPKYPSQIGALKRRFLDIPKAFLAV